jgi:hypothetical protein
MIDELERLPEAKALLLGQRDLVMPPVVLQRLAPPDRAADLSSSVRPTGLSNGTP